MAEASSATNTTTDLGTNRQATSGDTAAGLRDAMQHAKDQVASLRDQLSRLDMSGVDSAFAELEAAHQAHADALSGNTGDAQAEGAGPGQRNAGMQASGQQSGQRTPQAPAASTSAISSQNRAAGETSAS